MMYRILVICVICALQVQGQFNNYEGYDDHRPLPYNFGYAVQNHDGGHFRKETGDGHGGVKGSYGYTDPNGIRREVHYVADHNGFRANVKTNEPGTVSGNPADVNWQASGHHLDGFHNYRSIF